MIKNVIFDMGDVLIGYRWKDMLMYDFGVPEEDALKIGKALFDDPIWKDLDAGVKTLDAVIEYYTTKNPQYAPIIRRFFDEAERMAVKRPRVWEHVQNVKDKGYRLYLLSNYSECLFNKHTQDVPVLSLMDGLVISYKVNLIKPDPAIYRYILDEYNLNPEECIFYDDKKENVDAAISVGINAVQITSEDVLIEELQKL